MQIKHPQYFGQVLLSKGFRVWFLYMFYVVEGTKFVEEAIHEDLLKTYQDIYDLKSIRNVINVCPRSAKTSMTTYFLTFCLAKEPKCNFIYTSFSQILLASISKKVYSILEHPVYRAMYNHFIQPKIEQQEESPIDNFWADYLQKDNNEKNLYSATRILIASGGTLLFVSIGSTITGFGAGIRSITDKFTGAVIVDDPNKVSEIRSETMRLKTIEYFNGTLLSRLNHSSVAILIIQQRLHVEDLSGYVLQKYNYSHLIKPLLVNDICQLPYQYSVDRIEELKKDAFNFQAQYQQSPMLEGGNVIKDHWFRYYDNLENTQLRSIFITGDTASKVKQHNDYTVFCLWAVSCDNQLYLLDMIRGKWEAPELKQNVLAFYNKWRSKYFLNNKSTKNVYVNALYIEDKASGTGLIQELSRSVLPVLAVQVDADKLTRLHNVQSYIEGGRVCLPKHNQDHIVKPFIDECIKFTRDDSHKHDDIVDNLTMALSQAFEKGQDINYVNIDKAMDQHFFNRY